MAWRSPHQVGTTEPPGGSVPGGGGNIQAPGECGLGNGQKATGDPIKLGNITTSVPGIDFTTGPAMMDAYFQCVNDNGGINGRPSDMLEENDNLKPEESAGSCSPQAHRDRQGRRDGRWLQHHRLPGQR